MNKIYKVIYSKAKHSFVVVSELAHSHTKPAADPPRLVSPGPYGAPHERQPGRLCGDGKCRLR